MSTSVAQMVAAAKAQVEAVAPKALAEELAAGDVVVVDVREPVEWENYIPGAVQIPRGLLEFVADQVSPRHHPDLEFARRVVVYCHSGARAALAAVTLQEMGFTNVANLDGGFGAWTSAGLQTASHHAGI